jgi:hypothetical protein
VLPSFDVLYWARAVGQCERVYSKPGEYKRAHCTTASLISFSTNSPNPYRRLDVMELHEIDGTIEKPSHGLPEPVHGSAAPLYKE